MMRHLKASDLRRMPWKNGRGSTLEIASDATPGSSNWTWRVSVADVPESGPFSFFPGFERIIACVEGNGMRLAIAGREAIDVPRSGAGHRFSGDDATEGQLIDGPVRDANLFLKRGMWEGQLLVVRGGAVEVQASEMVCVFALEGQANVRTSDESLSLDVGEAMLGRAAAAHVHVTERAVAVVAWARPA